MGIGPLLLKVLQTVTFANGALVVVACALAGILLSSRTKKWPAQLPINIISSSAFYLLCALALTYALYPNFVDHAEPAMATLGIVMLKGKSLYPGLDEYSFHGLLYGPLLSEIQAVAIFLGSAIADLPVILSSKLAGVLAFFLASIFFFKVARGWAFARTYYTLFLLPFGVYVFWNRCEPAFLLLVAFCLWAITSFSRPYALLALGVCAGLASGLKLHGFLYIAPVVVILLSRERIRVDAVLISVLSATGSFLLVFLPGNVSLFSFVDYLLMASRHGLEWNKYLINLIFLCALWSPLIVGLARTGRWHELLGLPILALGAMQMVVAIVASKPGAGIHHLLPFIPSNALVFARCIGSNDDSETASEHKWASNLVWIAMLLPGLAGCAMLSSTMAKNWRIYDEARQELILIQGKHPDIVMGLAGNKTYPFAFLRPMLEAKGAAQVEYSSYMDLQLIGVPDIPLIQAMKSCVVRRLAMPKGESPFSLTTSYDYMSPLFSDGVREIFGRRYVKVADGRWYDTYECVSPLASQSHATPNRRAR